ncbi:MAG TPA: hypothetical protein VLG49_04385, partial [Rhabdochlamydiaceae bacterium]|nr:hypothetical protein [Rhabdochlamydiaceae bacterium]
MSIDDLEKYRSEETNYNKYISELEEISKSKDDVSEKCNKLFESFRTQLERIPPSLTSAIPPSAAQIKEVISFLKGELHRKTSQLAQQIVQSKIELLDPEIYKKFPYSLRFEIATCCAADDGYGRLSEMIKAYAITDQNDIYELVKIRLSIDPLHVCIHFKDYGITDEEKGFEVAKSIASGVYGGFLLDFYPNFNISDRNKAFELMKITAQQHTEMLSTSAHLTIFLNTIKDPQKRYEIACIVASKNLESLYNFMKELQILDQDQRFNLAQIAAQAHGIDVIKDLDQFGITDVNQTKVIYRLCYEHAMKKFYLYEDKEPISSLSFPDHIQWGFSSTLRMWLDRAIALKVPLDFETESEKIECEEKINRLLSDLINEGAAAGFSENRLKSLSDKVILKADSLQQQMKYLIWLGDFLMRCGFEPALKPLLEDESAAPTFEEVFKLTNPILQIASTVALTEIYNNEDKKKIWLSFSQRRPEHLLLTTLLLMSRGIDEKVIQRILESLKTKRYTDYKLMQSINERICYLTEKSGLSVQDQSRLLKLVLIEPEKESRERPPDYQKRVQDHRTNQEVLLAAISSLILFERSELLQDVPDAKTLVDKWNSTAGEIFGIHDAEMLEKFNSIFCRSKRYPNGLLVYAARMQMLYDKKP